MNIKTRNSKARTVTRLSQILCLGLFCITLHSSPAMAGGLPITIPEVPGGDFPSDIGGLPPFPLPSVPPPSGVPIVIPGGGMSLLSLDRDENVDQRYVRALREMTNEFSHVMIQQVQMLGVMLDAKNQLEAQRLLGEGRAQAQRDYHPSEQVCAIGTLAQIPIAGRYHVDANTLALNTIMQRRELLSANMASAWGPFSDKISRLNAFRRIYCNRNDNNGDLRHDSICNPEAANARPNADINYGSLIDRQRTLDVDFTDDDLTATERDILALAKNLFSSETFTQIPAPLVSSPYEGAAWQLMMDTRMIAAVRGVARHSFATIVGLKARGRAEEPAEQLRTIMQNLGVGEEDTIALIGANPSYYAQMDLITQTVFQDPTFYTGLYESPVNVSRQGVAMQALRLISDQDKLEHALRREIVLSMWLEMKLRDLQDRIQNNIFPQTP
jgi:hypothetical protein